MDQQRLPKPFEYHITATRTTTDRTALTGHQRAYSIQQQAISRPLHWPIKASTLNRDDVPLRGSRLEAYSKATTTTASNYLWMLNTWPAVEDHEAWKPQIIKTVWIRRVTVHTPLQDQNMALYQKQNPLLQQVTSIEGFDPYSQTLSPNHRWTIRLPLVINLDRIGITIKLLSSIQNLVQVYIASN